MSDKLVCNECQEEVVNGQCGCECSKGRCSLVLPVPMLVKDGWTVDFGFLTEVSEAVHKTEYGDEGISHEMLEAVIIELNRRKCLHIKATTQ